MSYADLPLSCRQCGHRESKYLYPAWTHSCLKGKPMVDGCNWKQARHPNFEEQTRVGLCDET